MMKSEGKTYTQQQQQQQQKNNSVFLLYCIIFIGPPPQGCATIKMWTKICDEIKQK